MNDKPTMLIILDGFGYSENKKGNAIKQANMPTWNFFLQNFPSTLLKASGKYVGLLPGYVGNSEVGHICIGSGRIIKTTLVKFHEEIENKTFFQNELLIKKLNTLRRKKTALHLIGLLSDGGVHSHEEHLHALLQFASNLKLEKVYIHCFLDGRDVPPMSAKIYLERLEKVCKKLNCGKIASLHGRFYAMDRDQNWNRTKVTYDILCNEENIASENQSWQDLLLSSYQENITDEFFKPKLLIKKGQIKNGDGVIFFNFRPDRARQLTRSFIDPNFDKFKTKKLNLKFFITTTRYKDEFKSFENDVIFEKEKIEHTLLDEISRQTNKPVFIIAETEKYAHVTYFFRGMQEKQFPNETRTLIPSIKTKSYVNNPEMSAAQITEKLILSFKENPAYFYLVNYANPDMVGHSGNLQATIKACEFLDKQLKILYKQVVEKIDGTIIVMSDHGNAEEMLDLKTNKPKTSHTTNPVPFVIIGNNYSINKQKLRSNLGLANVAPTILKMFNLQIPVQMEKDTII